MLTTDAGLQSTDRHVHLWHLGHMDSGKMDVVLDRLWSQGYIEDTFKRFCVIKTEAPGCSGNGPRSQYDSVLKAALKIKADGTSAFSQARHTASQRRPDISPISLVDILQHSCHQSHHSIAPKVNKLSRSH